MAIEVAAWNVAKNLGAEDTAAQVIEGVKRLNADFVVLSEAWGNEGTTPYQYSADALGRITDFGFTHGYDYVASTPYEDSNLERYGGPEVYEQFLVVLGRSAVKDMEHIRLGSRNATSATIEDPETRQSIQAIGAHFDDRSESLRLGMASGLIDIVDIDAPLMLAGDLNAMHADSRPARILDSRPADFLIDHIPEVRNKSFNAKLDRAEWFGQRLLEMADGSTLRYLARFGLSDTDPKHQSTITHAGLPFGQLDHIMVSGQLEANNFQLHKLAGSDHRAISSTVKVFSPL